MSTIYRSPTFAPIERILLPIDYSDGSQAAIDLAGLLAERLSASLTIFHVTETPDVMAGIVPGASAARDLEDAASAASVLMAGIADGLRARGLARVETAIAAGSPSVAILERARTGQFDMIVMGTHGRSGVRRLLMGSVAEAVMRGARCPVVTVAMPRGQ